MAALAQERITALSVPAEQGGDGQGLFAIVRVCEELGTRYASAGLCFGMHCVGTAVIAAKASDWQKSNYLEPIAAGKHITTLALSEPGTGAHFYFPQTELRSDGDNEIVITGQKSFVTNGSHADSYVISTKAENEDASPEQFSCVVLDENTPGMEWQGKWEGMGMRGNSSLSLKLDNIRINRKHVLGNESDQLWYVFNVVAPNFLVAMAGTYLGVAEAALREARSHLVSRTYSHNEGRLSHVAVMQHKLGRMWESVESARRLIYHAAHSGDRFSDDSLPAILAAKNAAAHCAVNTVNEALTILGGRGYQHDGFMGMLLRDSRAADVMSPTTDLLYTWLGRALLDQPILAE